MKQYIFFLAIIISGLVSCRKDNYEDMLDMNSASSADYRDSVVGIYTGQVIHTFYSSQFNLDINDTTYTTLQVTKDALNPDQVILTGLPEWESVVYNHCDQNDCTIHGVNQIMPYARGNFTTTLPRRLMYTYGHINMGGTSIYSFDLVKL